MELVNSIFQILLTSVIQLFSLIGVIIVIGFLLGYLESLTRMYWSRAFWKKRLPFNSLDRCSDSRTWTCHYVCTISS